MGAQSPPGCDRVCFHTTSPSPYQTFGGWFSQAQLCLLYLVLVALLSSAGKLINTFPTFISRFKGKNVIFKYFVSQFSNTSAVGYTPFKYYYAKVLSRKKRELFCLVAKTTIELLAVIPKACTVAEKRKVSSVVSMKKLSV